MAKLSLRKIKNGVYQASGLLRTLLASGAAVLLFNGCGLSAHDVVVHDATVAAGSATLAIETAQTSAEMLYKTEQEFIVKQAMNSHMSYEETSVKIQDVRARWEPVWKVFSEARAAQLKLLDALHAYATDGSSLGTLVQLTADLAQLEEQIGAALEKGRSDVQKAKLAALEAGGGY